MAARSSASPIRDKSPPIGWDDGDTTARRQRISWVDTFNVAGSVSQTSTIRPAISTLRHHESLKASLKNTLTRTRDVRRRSANTGIAMKRLALPRLIASTLALVMGLATSHTAWADPPVSALP